MADAGDEGRPDRTAKRTPSERTYDPNANSLWPMYPPGTRLPMPNWSVRKQLLILLFVLAIMGGGGLLVWWLVGATASR
jgi:hypothetical protein